MSPSIVAPKFGLGEPPTSMCAGSDYGATLQHGVSAEAEAPPAMRRRKGEQVEELEHRWGGIEGLLV